MVARRREQGEEAGKKGSWFERLNCGKFHSGLGLTAPVFIAIIYWSLEFRHEVSCAKPPSFRLKLKTEETLYVGSLEFVT